MTPFSPDDIAIITAQVRRLQPLRDERDRLLSRVEQAKQIVHASDSDRWERIGFVGRPDRLAGAWELYHRTDQDTRRDMLQQYGYVLEQIRESPFPGSKPLKINYATLPLAARPYLLAPYLNLVVGDEFPRFDFERSNLTLKLLTYLHTAGPANPDQWRAHLPTISAWLGSNWQIFDHRANTVTLIKREPLPDQLPMQQRWLQHESLFLGLETDSNLPHHLPFTAMTSGTLVLGASG